MFLFGGGGFLISSSLRIGISTPPSHTITKYMERKARAIFKEENFTQNRFSKKEKTASQVKFYHVYI
jgi:hypothetical protein